MAVDLGLSMGCFFVFFAYKLYYTLQPGTVKELLLGGTLSSMVSLHCLYHRVISGFLITVFSTGAIKGGNLMDISLGPLAHHLYSVCGIFKEITLLRFSPRCIMELRKWLDYSTEAFDWSHISSLIGNLPVSR